MAYTSPGGRVFGLAAGLAYGLFIGAAFVIAGTAILKVLGFCLF